MAIKLTVIANQIAPAITGWKAYQSFYVDDAYTKGLEFGKLVGVATGTSQGTSGLDEATVHYAGHVGATYSNLADGNVVVPAIKACGVIYDPSTIDSYRRTDDQTNETRLFPYGQRENRRIAMIPEFVWHLQDDTNYTNLAYFRKLDETIDVADVVSFDDATATIVLSGDFSGDIKVEEKMEIDGDTYWATSVSYDDVAGETTVVLNDGAGDIALAITLKSVLFDDVYLADDMTGDLPFTLIYEAGRQKIGTIESTYAVRAKLR